MPIIDNRRNDEDVTLKFIYNPLIEMICSLHALSDFTHHEDNKVLLKDILEKMDADLKKDIFYFSAHYYQWLFIMDLFSEYILQGDYHNLTSLEIIFRMQQMDRVEFSYLFLGTTLNQIDTVRSWLLDPKQVQSAVDLPLFQYIAQEDVYYFVLHTDEVQQKLISIISRYWKNHFHMLWNWLETAAVKEVELNKSIISQYSIQRFLSEQEGIAVVDNVVHIPHYPHLRIVLEDIKELTILFSTFTKPHMLMHIHKPKFIIYRYFPIALPDHSATFPSELPELLKALGDKTRFRIIMELRDAQKSTKDLSEILSLSPSTISQHLTILKNADLVDFYKDKKFIYYKVNRKRLDQMFEMLKLLIV